MKQTSIAVLSNLSRKKQKALDDLIVETLSKFPDAIAKKVCREVLIYARRDALGSFLRSDKKKIIILNVTRWECERVGKRERIIILAHEFLHAFLDTDNEHDIDIWMVKLGFCPVLIRKFKFRTQKK